MGTEYNVEEWMGHLRIKANECGYKERGRMLKEKIINGISDEEIMMKIIRELTAT